VCAESRNSKAFLEEIFWKKKQKFEKLSIPKDHIRYFPPFLKPLRDYYPYLEVLLTVTQHPNVSAHKNATEINYKES